jgi:transglutaminase-like putative cysteine protease
MVNAALRTLVRPIVARYRVVHQTDYQYQNLVTLSQQYLHLSPRSFAFQDVLRDTIKIAPGAEESTERLDYFGNKVQHMVILEPHHALSVRSEFEVALRARYSFSELKDSIPWEVLRDSRPVFNPGSSDEPQAYLYASPHVNWNEEIRAYALASYTPARPHLEAALNLTKRIFDDFEFDGEATDISTPLEQVLKGRRGVCQDFAQLMIACLRSLGLAVRYVSGYILTHPPEGEARLIGADASHAWVSVFCPKYGWVDFDPTNRCLVQHEHITLGWGRDFSDVTPLRGVVLGGDQQQLVVSVTVTPLT